MATFIDLNGLTQFWKDVKKYLGLDISAATPADSDTFIFGDADDTFSHNSATVPKLKKVTGANLATYIQGKISGSFAPLNSPAFTGTPTAPTASPGTNNTQIATTAYVDAILGANDAMIFKGTVGTGGTHTIAAFNALATYSNGWAYKVIEAGTIKGRTCAIGDMLIATVDRAGSGNVDADWTDIQNNMDGAVTGPASATDGAIVLFDGTTGKLVKNSVTPSNTPITFSVAGTRANIASGESLAILFGKIAKYFTDLGAAAFAAIGSSAGQVAAGDHNHSGVYSASGHAHAESEITFTDITTKDASTTAHGYAPKVVAPAAGNLSVLGVANAETVRAEKLLLDTTTPSTQAFGDAASAGTSLKAARVDHKHAMPSTAPSHTHGNITNAGAIGSTSGLPIETGTSGVLQVSAFADNTAIDAIVV